MSDQNIALLELCRLSPCQLQLGEPCGTYPSVPCHSDMLRHGRGVGHKSWSWVCVPGCPDCHAKFTRANLGREGYEQAWIAGHERFMQWAWDGNYFVVIGMIK